MKATKKLSALFLTAGILLTGSACTQAAPDTPQTHPVYDTSEHGEITLQEMIDSYQGVDPDALNSSIDLLEEYYAENKDDKNAPETVVRIYEDICEIYEQQHQQLIISELLSYLDISDEELSERAARDSTNMVLLQNQGRSAVRNALNGPYGDALRKVIDPNQLHAYLDTIEYTPEMEELTGRFSSLVSEYHLSMSRPVVCEYDGQVYSSDDQLPEEHQEEISRALWLVREEQIAPLYAEMITNLNAFARLLGYENYLDYNFTVEYNRDYTPDDVKKMIDSIYELCAPLLLSSTNCIGDASLQKPLELDNEALLNILSENLDRVSTELMESLDYMMKYRLYSIGDEPERVNGSYMEPVYPIKAGFIFIRRANTLADYNTLVHEFGHFNNGYQVYSPALGHTNNLDILEVHSQGLEQLMSESIGNIIPAEFGDYGASITQNKVQILLSAVMIGRFEIECFEHPEMSAAQMRETMDRYASMVMAGADELSDVRNLSSWTQIHHLFDAPLYYISYAISALSALDVYSEYLKDPQTGWDKYTQLTHAGPDMRYIETVDACGLHDMTKEENIRSVMETLAAHYQSEFTEQMNDALKKGKMDDFMDHLEANISSAFK